MYKANLILPRVPLSISRISSDRPPSQRDLSAALSTTLQSPVKVTTKMKITLTTLALLAPALALPSSEIHNVHPLMRGMTPRATFNEAEGKCPSFVQSVS